MPSLSTTRAPAAPFPQGMRRPTFRYTLYSVDEQVRSFSYALDETGELKLVRDTGWDDEDALLETAEACLDVVWPGGAGDDVLNLSGEQHRDIEDGGTFDALLRGIALGLPARVVLGQLTETAVAA